MSEQKVLIIRNPFAYDFGGGEKFPVNLAVELGKNNIKSILVSRSPKVLEYAQSKGVKTAKGWWWSRQNWSGKSALLFPIYVLWQIALTLWYIVKILQLKITVVHPQGKDDFIAATFAGKLLGKKVIWTDHADLKDIFAKHTVWYKNPVGKFVYFASKFADTITLVSNSEKSLIEKQLGKKVPAKYVVIYNGVLDTYKPVAKDNKDFVFVMTSRLVFDKGIGEVIAAFKKLVKTYPNALLHIYGTGPESEKFMQEGKGVKGLVFKGHAEDIETALLAADVFVHPSYREGFSLSLVEAAMYSLPIIATNVGGNPEIVTNGVNGLLIKPQDADELQIAMQKLIANPALRKKMGAESRQIYLKSLQFDVLVKEAFIPLYVGNK